MDNAAHPGNSGGIFNHVRGANEGATPDLLRVALKMASGTGKTTVMAMLIAWQTINAVRKPNSPMFTKGFLITTPGITIRDRLRVLLPSDPENYYEHRNLVPSEFIPAVREAKVVITNYHAFRLRDEDSSNRTNRSFRYGRGPRPDTTESDGKMMQRAMKPLMSLKRIMAFNDEGHHCYSTRMIAWLLESRLELHYQPNLHVRAFQLASQLKQSAAYDAHYLALAESFGCELWTADEKFYRAASPSIDKVRWIREFGALE